MPVSPLSPNCSLWLISLCGHQLKILPALIEYVLCLSVTCSITRNSCKYHILFIGLELFVLVGNDNFIISSLQFVMTGPGCVTLLLIPWPDCSVIRLQESDKNRSIIFLGPLKTYLKCCLSCSKGVICKWYVVCPTWSGRLEPTKTKLKLVSSSIWLWPNLGSGLG